VLGTEGEDEWQRQEDDRLWRAAYGFAQDLTRTVQGTVDPGAEAFRATLAGRRPTGDAEFYVAQKPELGIVLRVQGEPLLRLRARYRCAWDHAHHFLAVQDSKLSVAAEDVTEPLFRFDYQRAPAGDGIPSAHLQVHADRAEITDVMAEGGPGTRRARKRQRDVESGVPPRLADLHFPLGGSRFRPCLEDVLEMLVRELGVDYVDGWADVLKRGRASWRRGQTAAAVRDTLETAKETLRLYGYPVGEHPDGPRPDRTDRLEAP
jgi:hypothetical protein